MADSYRDLTVEQLKAEPWFKEVGSPSSSIAQLKRTRPWCVCMQRHNGHDHASPHFVAYG